MTTQSVVVATPDQTAPAGHEAAMHALVDSKSVEAVTRPEWLPEKFKTVEEMAASYKELEAKLGAPKPAAAADVAPAAVPPADAPKDLTVPQADAAAAAVASAGLDMAALNAEFAQAGDLSEASRTALAAKGFDKATVDNYIAGQQALNAQFTNDAMSATPGGPEKFVEMVEWAKVNLTPAEIDSFNAAVDSAAKTRNGAAAKLAVAGLGARFAAAVGSEPVLVGGLTHTSAGDTYGSIAEMKADMRTDKYRTDSAFRKMVQQKLGRSSIM